MNRQMKRMMERQGQVDSDGAATQKAPERRPQARPPHAERSNIAEFFGDVQSELRKVVWPSRREVINYASLVFVMLVILIAAIFGLDYVLVHGVNFLMKK